ncbi:MAG: hypothetical protein KH354_03880 [Clostridiales bacterium]|nr:hypothetical protein [Clostridiales bacterium]
MKRPIGRALCETCVHNRVCGYKADRLLDEEEGVNRCAEHLYLTCGSCDYYQECKDKLKKTGLDPAGAVICPMYDNIRQTGLLKRLWRRLKA